MSEWNKCPFLEHGV